MCPFCTSQTVSSPRKLHYCCHGFWLLALEASQPCLFSGVFFSFLEHERTWTSGLAAEMTHVYTVLSFSFAHLGAGRLEEVIMCLTPGGTGFAVPSTSW